MPQAIPRPNPRATLLQRVGTTVAGAGMGWLLTRPVNQIRARVGLPRMGPEGITSKLLNLIAISPAVYPPDPAWEARHQVTGYWFSETPRGWVPPSRLAAFLAAGDPPIVVSLGAMALAGADTLEAAQITLAALAETGQRAVVQGWDVALNGLSLPATILRAGSVPHGWLLPRAAAVVHHGGFGTTASGLRAGIPAVVVPHIIDQFLWGQRLHELGVAPKPIARGKLTMDGLAQALEQARSDEAMRARAAALGAQIRAERGVEQAMRLMAASLAGLGINFGLAEPIPQPAGWPDIESAALEPIRH
jgi:UDP:flavonoid glycosyltransferase YjiC (YdhE family)